MDPVWIAHFSGEDRAILNHSGSCPKGVFPGRNTTLRRPNGRKELGNMQQLTMLLIIHLHTNDGMSDLSL